MKVLHLMTLGRPGGIEILNRDYVQYSELEHFYLFVWGGGSIADEMTESGSRVQILNTSKMDFVGPLKYIDRICRTEKMDVIAVPYIAPVLYVYAMFMKRKYPHIRLLAYIHESAENTYKPKGNIRDRVKTVLIHQFLKKSDGIIAISEYVKQSLVQCYYMEKEKIIRIYNGIVVDCFDQKEYIKNSVKELIYVGRLTEGKGVQNIIRALSLLPPEYPWRFRIAGSGIYQSELEVLVKQCGLEEKIQFLGITREVPDLLANSDIFIHLPQWEEGFGITIIEAMASGLICVCNNSGAIPEIITDGKNGYLLEKDNIEGVANKLLWIMEHFDDVEMQQMRAAARSRAEDFDMQIYTENMDRILKNMCNIGEKE